MSGLVVPPVDDPIMRQLRARTAEHHARAESIMGTLLSIRQPTEHAYRATLARLAGWYFPFEQELDAWTASLMVVDIDWPSRRKTEALARDLAVLGIEAAHVPLCAVPPIRDLDDALGTLYVMEGATNGARVLTRLVVAPLGFTAARGGAFFWEREADTAPRWRSFGSAVTAYLGSEADAARRARITSALVASAQRTFDSLTEWLRCAPPS